MAFLHFLLRDAEGHLEQSLTTLLCINCVVFGSSNSTAPETLAQIFLQEIALMGSPLCKESWSPRNLQITIKDTENAGRRGRSLSKVNRLHLAPKSLPTPLPQFVPTAAAELGAGSGFHAIHRPVCFHFFAILGTMLTL